MPFGFIFFGIIFILIIFNIFDRISWLSKLSYALWILILLISYGINLVSINYVSFNPPQLFWIVCTLLYLLILSPKKPKLIFNCLCISLLNLFLINNLDLTFNNLVFISFEISIFVSIFLKNKFDKLFGLLFLFLVLFICICDHEFDVYTFAIFQADALIDFFAMSIIMCLILSGIKIEFRNYMWRKYEKVYFGFSFNHYFDYKFYELL